MSSENHSEASDGHQDGEEGFEVAQRQHFPSSYFKPKPVKVGEELEVTVSETSKKGDGVARVEGYVIFVPSAKLGDKVKIKITMIRPNYAMGELLGGVPPPPGPG